MRIQFLGTGDAFCSGGRFQTCFQVTADNFNFLIDCGATSLLAMKAGDMASDLIDGIIISHFHGDHFGGLPYLLIDANYQAKRTRPMLIAGPPGVEKSVQNLLSVLYPTVKIAELSFEVIFKQFNSDNTIEFGPLAIETYPVIHVEEALPHGIRVLFKDQCLAFSGDTGWTDNLYQIASNADLFICECNYFKTVSTSHLNYPTIVSNLNKLNCKRIILNHLGPEMLDNMNSVNLECSYDGLTIDI